MVVQHIQFNGYYPETDHRTYNFLVRQEKDASREIIISIHTQLLSDNKFKYQDIPDFCFAKLKRDLAAETEANPVPPHIIISQQDLQAYLNEHYPVKKKPLYS
jgi:hypothetical protein